MFANGPGDRGSIPCRVTPKIQKVVLDTALLNTQNYKMQIKGKGNNPWKVVVPYSAPQMGAFGSSSTYYIYIYIYIYNIVWRTGFGEGKLLM